MSTQWENADSVGEHPEWCSQGHQIHLLTADDVVLEGRRCGTYLTLCGALLAANSLPESLCPEGCQCDLERLYCPACVREGASRSADAGLVDRASGALR